MTITINRRWRYSKHYNSQMSGLRLICLRFAKVIKKFYRAANGNFGKIGRVASEEVILHLISSKCLPILLYGLEGLPLYQYKLNSLDFVINRFFMKLFKTTDMYTVATLQEMFGFELPSVRIARRTVKFISKFNEGNCVFS